MTSTAELRSATISQTPGLTGSNIPVRTRSGRVVKQPERYTPQEVCEDDYASDEYDDNESSVASSDGSIDPEDISSESDADEHGNLDGFVVEDKSEESDIDNDVPATDNESGTDA